MDTSSSDDSSVEYILENGFPSSKMENDRPTIGRADVEYSSDSSCDVFAELEHPVKVTTDDRVLNVQVPDVSGITELNSLFVESSVFEMIVPFPVYGHAEEDREQFLSHREKLESSLTKYFSKLATVDQICVEQFEEEQTAPFPLRALKQTCMCDFPEDSECSICKKKLSDLASLCDSALDVMDQIYDCLYNGSTSVTIPISLICLAGETLERIIKSNENFESRSVPNSSLYRMIYRDELADNNPNSTVTEYIFQRICNRHSQFQIANIAEELSIIGKTHENATEKSSRKDITENNKKKKGLVKQSNRSPAGGSVRSRITKETSKNNTLKDSPASRTRSKKCKTPNCIDSPASRTRSKKSKKISSNEKGKDSKITVIKRKRKSLDGSQFIY